MAAILERGRRALRAPVRLYREIMQVHHEDPPPIAIPNPNAGTETAMANIGLLTFAGSRYGVALAVMGVITNRMHHLVRRAENAGQVPPTGVTTYLLPFHKFLTSHSALTCIRIPGILSLFRAWLLLSIVTLDAAGLWRKEWSDWPGLGRVGRWGVEMEMKDVSWQVFLCICFGILFGSLARSLSSSRRDTRPGEITPSFNLFGYSMLLHIYSSPLSHSRPATSLSVGRPDLDGLIHIWLTLTELTWLHAIELSDKWKRRRLLPTGVCGAVGLGHFYWHLWNSPTEFAKYLFVPYLMQAICCAFIGTTIFFNAISQIFTIGGIVPSQFLPIGAPTVSIQDDWNMLILSTAAACLKSSRFAAGMRNEVAVVEVKPAWVDLDRDGVMDMGMTTGNIEMSARRGFGREITIVKAQGGEEDPSIPALINGGNPTFSRAYRKLFFDVWTSAGYVLWGILKAGWKVTPGSESVEEIVKRLSKARWWYGPRHWKVWRAASWRYTRRKAERNWINEMRTARQRLTGEGGTPEQYLAIAQATEGLLRDLQDWLGRPREIPEAYTPADMVLLRDQLPPLERALKAVYKRYAYRSNPLDESSSDMVDDQMDELYRTFLAGEEMDDEDEGEEYNPRSQREMSIVSETSTDGYGEGEEYEEWADDDEGVLPAALYADLAIGEAGPSTPRATRSSRARSTTPTPETGLQPVLLAHMTSSSASPLTRRGYSRLLAQTGAVSSSASATPSSASSSALESNMLTIIQDRRIAHAHPDRDPEEAERQAMCAVCTCSPRDVILWPCRCLAICQDCRENMADRLQASSHICPCCRRSVEGFSRIFIP